MLPCAASSAPAKSRRPGRSSRKREHYEKPTTVRKRAGAAAVKRHLKKLSRTTASAYACTRRHRAQRPMSDPLAQASRDTITAAMKAAMKARDKERLGTIRLILSEFKRIEGTSASKLMTPGPSSCWTNDQTAP